MTNSLSVLAGTLISVVSFTSIALSQPACVTQNMAVPPGANTTEKAGPFFIDTTGLDFKTAPPTRDPSNPNYPRATELPDGTLPPPGAEGNFIIGPTHNPAPDDKSSMLVTTSHPGIWSRTIDVYVPVQYVPGTEVPFIVIGDGGSAAYKDLPTTLDNLIAQRRVPPMIAIQIGNGGQDAQGSQRGREYDAVSGAYAEFVEREVLPLVERNAGVKLTRNPDGRATMGLSSSGVAAFTMAWFYPDLYHRVLAFSPTMVNQQWPHDPALRGGAWEYHSAWTGPATPNLISKAGVLTPADPPGVPLILSAPTKPIRFWFFGGDQDLFYPNPTIPDGMHDWTLSNELTAKVLAEKGYHYQFLFVRNAKHVDRPTIAQTLPSRWSGSGRAIRFPECEGGARCLAPDRHAGGRAHRVLEARCVHVVEDLPRQHSGLAGRVEDRLAARGGEPVGLVGCSPIGSGCRRRRVARPLAGSGKRETAAITINRNNFAGMRTPMSKTSA